MKFLFVCEGLRAATARAQPWRHVIEISKRIQSLGNAVVVISDGSRETRTADEIQGVSIKRVERKGLLLDINELIKSIREEDADVVNWHASDSWSSYYLWRMASEVTDTVWTLHSGPLQTSDLTNIGIREALELPRYWNNILNALVPPLILRKWVCGSGIKRIITLSKRLSTHLQALQINLAHGSIHVIPSGVDTNQFRPVSQAEARQALGLLNEDPIALYYGPMSSFRGVDTLLNAMPFVRREISSAKLLLLGRGSEGNIRLGKYRGEPSTVFISRMLTQDEIIRYLAAADVVVLPFKFWPQVECPLTILESMAMRKAVVTTSAGAIPEIISPGENGVLVPPGDPTALAQKITTLLQSPEVRRRIARNARQHVEGNYDWNGIVKQTIDVCKDALMDQ